MSHSSRKVRTFQSQPHPTDPLPLLIQDWIAALDDALRLTSAVLTAEDTPEGLRTDAAALRPLLSHYGQLIQAQGD
jgi:hypothetical protein